MTQLSHPCHLTHTVVGFSLSEATPNYSTLDTATITTTADDSHGPYHQARYVRLRRLLYTLCNCELRASASRTGEEGRMLRRNFHIVMMRAQNTRKKRNSQQGLLRHCPRHSFYPGTLPLLSWAMPWSHQLAILQIARQIQDPRKLIFFAYRHPPRRPG